LTSELQQIYQSLGAAAGQQPGAAPVPRATAAVVGSRATGGSDDVIDAEFTAG